MYLVCISNQRNGGVINSVIKTASGVVYLSRSDLFSAGGGDGRVET